MGDTWDEEDFEPRVQPAAAALPADRWAGEDEDDDVKECWEDEEEEKKDEEKVEEKVVLPPAPKSKAKKLAEKLAEKEKAENENTEDFYDDVGLTKEEIILRKRKIQEESDLRVAMETFGITETSSNNTGGLDAFNPNTKEEFEEFKKALVDKISIYRDNEEFPDFITDLVKSICLHLNATTLKVLRANVENLCHEKQKLEKADKTKKPNKGKGKAKLMVEKGMSQHMYGYENDFGNELDDFM